MNWLKIISLSLIMLLFSSAQAFCLINTSEVYQKLEPLMLQREWKTVYKIMSDLPDDQSDPGAAEVRFMVHKARNIIDGCYRCEKLKISSTDTSEYIGCYKKVIEYDWNNLPSTLPFSKEFVDELNNKIALYTQSLNAPQEENSEEADAIQAQINENALRLEKEREEEKQAEQNLIDERKKEQDDEDRYIKAQEKAFNSYEYKEAGLSCSICEAIKNNKKSEERIAEERKYSAKYGTLNLSFIDNCKQNIKHRDHFIAEQKVEYKKLTQKAFNISLCKRHPYPCEDELENLRFRLMKKYGVPKDKLENLFPGME
jgi:hypothetical protein